MTSLADITGVKKELLREKFGLEPFYQFDREKKENFVFISPSVLVKATELKHGGDWEMSPKKVLSLVTKDILQAKDHTLFEVPEITALRMGYGKNSGNKEGRMAICEKDAKTWLRALDLSFAQLQNDEYKETKEDTDNAGLEEFETFDDTVYPCDSGLRIPQKGSRILLMSILILTKAGRKKKILTNGHDKDTKTGKIGANKISDFLAFWLLPYLLNFTQQKVKEITVHHRAACGQETSGDQSSPLTKSLEQTNGERNPYTLETVTKSAWDIISQSRGEIPSQLKEKLEKYFAEKLNLKYTLLKCDDGSPIVLVPLSCLYRGNKVPVRLEDIGTKWTSNEGTLMSREGFLHAFVRSREIQMDYFKCMKTVKLRTGVDYAIVFPDLDALESFHGTVRRTDPNVLKQLQELKSQGRGMKSPHMYHAVVKCSDQNVTVCFTYFQGKDNESMAALFRAVGAHYFNHFTILFLHGSTFKKHDPDCKLGHIYHVREAECMAFKRGKLQKGDNKKILSFRSGISNFFRSKFPTSFGWWVQSVHNDELVKAAGEQFVIEPEKFDPNQHLKVAFARNSQKNSLKNACLNKKKTIRRSNLKKLVDRDINAANLDGCCLSMIRHHGRKDNISVSLAISNTLGSKEPPSILKKAVNKVIYHFVMASINAGLREVFPSELGEEDQSSHGGPAAAAGASGPEGDKEVSDTGNEIVSNPSPSKRRKVNFGSDEEEEEDDKDEEEDDDDEEEDDEDEEEDNKDEEEDDEDEESEDKEYDDEKEDEDDKDEEEDDKDEEEEEEDAYAVEQTSQIVFKEGDPSDLELDELGGKISSKWQRLGLYLRISQEVLDEINVNEKDKPYRMLLYWKRHKATSSTPYRQLYNALCRRRVGERKLAEKFCCKKTR